MGLFDFLGDIVSTPFDMMGLSRHSRDQEIEQQNQRELMALQDQYHDENFSTEFAAENKEWWNRYSQTQSPAAQARQYRQIGVNPSVMIQNGSGGFHQTPVQTTAPSPPNIMPPSQGQIYQGGNNTDLLGDISRMELNEAQKDEIYALLSGKLKEQEDVHFLNEVVLAYKKLDYNIYQVFGYTQKSLELSKLYEDAFSSYLRGEESKANTKFLEARTILESDEHAKNKELLPTLRLQADALLQFTKAQANEANARATEALSSSKVNEANAYVLKNEGRIRAVAADVAEYGKTDRLQAEIDELWAKRAINQEQYKEACLKIARLDKLLGAYHSNGNKVKVDAAIENVLDILGLKFGSALQK